MTRLDDWIARMHERVHDRAPGTYGPDDLGAIGGCTCPEVVDVDAYKARARRGHLRNDHPGTPEGCQSPHDVLCKAIDWSQT